MNRLLVLAEVGDAGAAAVVDAIEAELGAAAVLWLSSAQLGLTHGWVHTVDPDGAARTRFETADGTAVTDASVGAVLNRLGYVAPIRFAGASPKDADYATLEFTALLWSWLAGLPVPVLNPPGRPRSAHGWLTAARRAGLPIAPVTVASGRRPAAAPPPPAGQILVTGERAHGPLALRWGEACVRLAAATGCPLLDCRFASLAGGPSLVAVDPLPSLDTPAAVEQTSRFLTSLLTAASAVR